ncbi:MAG: sucrase ferredoxin [Thermoleophilia bacterium]|nr:sucrase ferredoxin [Thermoleophilia bacterium]
MTRAAPGRPFCAEAARERDEPLDATASWVDTWLLVEHVGYWPYEPLEASAFAGPVREHLRTQLASRRPARLLLVKRPGRRPAGSFEVIYGRSDETGGRFRRLTLDSYDELLRLDLAGRRGELLRHPLLLACTHGIRDRCCARYGQALARELGRQADPEWVRQASHVGGDRFAGNLVVLPEGLYFGRVAREDVAPVLAAYRTRRLELARYRGRSAHSFPVQAAEGHVRRATGLAGLDDLRLVAARREGRGRFRVELEALPAGTVHEVEVELQLGAPVLLTCRADEARPPRRYVVRSHRERAR